MGSPAAESPLGAAPLIADRPDPAPALGLLPRVGGCRITGELAAGGMAVLYRGVQESLGRPVAIKALRSDVLVEHATQRAPNRPDWVQRFVREARILSLLQHENLVHVYDLVDLREQTEAGPAGSLFIVMELCEGVDLLDLLDRLVDRLGQPPTLPVDVAALIALGAAKALAHIHTHQILHRDVKPANLFVTSSGIVKLLDFGTAWDPANPSDRLGREVGLGTPSYMSPEQALGASLDHRSDQFSLGVVLYQMLGGRKPFGATVPPRGQRESSVLEEVARAEPPPLHELNRRVPEALLEIVSRCLDRQPARRYPTTDELAQALERWVSQAVPGNLRARLVEYLVELQFVTPEDAARVLRPFGVAAELPAAQPAPHDKLISSWLRRLWG